MTQFDNVETIFPLSPIQEGMLYHTLSATRPGVFITQVCLALSGDISLERLRRAWERVVSHHSALRTAFFWDGLDEPLQVVRSDVELSWQVLDWRDRDEAAFEAFLAEDRTRALDLTQAPVMRFALLQTGDDNWRHVWTIHHMVADGWSANIVLRDVFSELAQTGIVSRASYYGAYVDRALDANTPQAQEFWAERLSHRTESTWIVDPLVSPETGHGHLRGSLGSEDTARLVQFARSARVTQNTVILGAWARLLATYADDESPMFGTTLTVRPRDIEDIDDAVGVYLNTLPLEVPLVNEPLRDWLPRIQAQLQAMQPHALMSLKDIQMQSGIKRAQALFQSIVVFENHGSPDEVIRTALSGTAIKAGFDRIVDQSNFSLALLATPGEELGFELIFDRTMFGDDFAASILDALRTILLDFMSDVDAPPTRAATTRFLAAETLAEEAAQPLHEVIASRDPNATALRVEGKDVCYRQLNAAADGLAAQLSGAGIGPGNFVGLYAARGTAFVTGMLAIMKSGAAFVPIDPGYPAKLNAEVVATMSLSMILAEPAMCAAAQEMSDLVLAIDGRNRSDVWTGPSTGADESAYVIHTSGSQGTRKGVLVRHGNIAYSTVVRREVYGRGPERFLLLSPVAFDSALVGLFWTLSEGGTLVLPKPGQERDIDEIARLIAAEKVTHVLCIPSLYRLLLEFAPLGGLASLDTVIVAGEACPSDIVEMHDRTIPQARLFNEYGPTEAAVWCLAAELEGAPEDGRVPIGRPIPGTTAYLLDRWGKPVPDGVAGELCIAGPGIAAGYLNMAQLTAEKFVRDPVMPHRRMYKTGDLAVRRPSGEHLYLGRADDQIKLNGFRVEPMEISNALLRHPDVEDAFVALRPVAAATDPNRLADLLSDLATQDAEAILARVEAMSDAQIAAELADI